MKKKSNMPGRHISDISLNYTKHKPTKFYQTGIPELDEFTGGLPSGEMTLVAARPGDGKTALAMQMVEHIAEYHQEPCGVFSIEMTGQALVTRMVLARTGLPSVALRKAELTQKQAALRDKALQQIAKLPIYIDESSIATIRHVEKTAMAWIKGGVRFFALDYIQLMSSGSGGGNDTRANFIGSCARALGNISRDHDIPFLVLCQLNRESAKAKRPPTTADLKESGDLEQVAQNIILLYPDRDSPPNVDLILGKWRNGPMGTVSCQFDSARTRFESIKKED